jgi:hypothetical protein
VYELAYDGKGKDGMSFLSGLIELGRLGYDEKKSGVLAGWSGLEAKKSGPSRAEVGGVSGGGRGEVLSEIPEENAEKRGFEPKTAHKGIAPKIASYSDAPVVLTAAKVN